MNQPSVSVIIVSRGRPDALARCLMGLEQLFCPTFEVVVVADALGTAKIREIGLEDALKLVRFDDQNISVARNLGIAQAAGEVVAFIDDDSVPEPTWLDALIAPFSDDTVAAAGGYVRGRNGISFQSRGAWVDSTGAETSEPGAGVFETRPGRAIKTVGTNCAFRRETLASIGGFDPLFRFYLDETDVNLRLAARNASVALVPSAEVHHGFMASTFRQSSRMPKDLYQIGASLTAFLRKHHTGDVGPILDQERKMQRARLIRHLTTGNCEPRDIGRLLKTLENGFAAGQFRKLRTLSALPSVSSDFKPFKRRVAYGDPVVISGRIFDQSLRNQARDLVAKGHRVSLFKFSRTALYHRVWFENGVWIQSGGLFGKSSRRDSRFKSWSFVSRLGSETKRVAKVRGLTEHLSD